MLFAGMSTESEASLDHFTSLLIELRDAKMPLAPEPAEEAAVTGGGAPFASEILKYIARLSFTFVFTGHSRREEAGRASRGSRKTVRRDVDRVGGLVGPHCKLAHRDARCEDAAGTGARGGGGGDHRRPRSLRERNIESSCCAEGKGTKDDLSVVSWLAGQVPLRGTISNYSITIPLN